MILKNEYPILEFCDSPRAVIEPAAEQDLPEKCLMTFFGEVLDAFVQKTGAVRVGTFESEMREFPIYVAELDGHRVALIQSSVGGASAAMQADYLFGRGVRVLFCCGSCGALDDIPAGAVIIPTRALRGEGTSYYYLPPSRFVELDRDVIDVSRRILAERGVAYVETSAWTTDGFYRECAEMVEYRKSEGCAVVEMECASLAAVCRFRNIRYGQLLYSGDILCDTDNYDDRDWYSNRSARELLFGLSLEVLAAL